MSQQAAYNLEIFENRQARPVLRVAKSVKKKRILARYNLRGVKIAALATVLLALVCSVLYSQTVVTELAAQIVVQQNALADKQNEYTYLNTQLNMTTNVRAVEDYAVNQLHMIKRDKSQITYITDEGTNYIIRPGSVLDGLAGNISNGLLSFMEYMAP